MLGQHKRSSEEMNSSELENRSNKKQKIPFDSIENNNNNNNNSSNYEDSTAIDDNNINFNDKLGEQKVSKVLHCRNVPTDVTEQELTMLACPFGQVSNILILKGKNQAFIEMEDVTAATKLIQYSSSIQPSIRGKYIYMQYSKRDEITVTDDAPLIEIRTPILLVSISNVQYQINVDVLYRVFSQYGEILKIVIFSKNGLQSFIEYRFVESAVVAKKELDSKDIYSGCCTLRIQFSQLASLNVKYNNEKSFDFRNTNLPTGYGDNMTASSSAWNSWGNSPYTPYFNVNTPVGSSVLIASGIPDNISTDQLFTLFGVYGDVIRVKILFNKKNTALLQFATSQQASIAMNNLHGLSFRGKQLNISYSKHQSISLPKLNDTPDNYTHDYTNSPLHRYKIAGSKNFQHITPPSNILHISNISLNIEEELLSEKFSKFGRINAVKFFSNRKMALIEYSTIGEAVEALLEMHNCNIGGQSIRVSFSKSSLYNLYR